MSIRFTDLAQDKDATTFKEAFEEVVSSKVVDVLEAAKKEVAKKMMGGLSSVTTKGNVSKGWPSAPSAGASKLPEEAEQIDEAAGSKVSDYPHFHKYASGAVAQNSGGTPQQVGKEKIPEHMLDRVKNAEAELKQKKKEGHDLHQMGQEADEGKNHKMKHAPRALEGIFY